MGGNWVEFNFIQVEACNDFFPEFEICGDGFAGVSLDEIEQNLKLDIVESEVLHFIEQMFEVGLTISKG